jgi:hypothetical protein
MTGSWRTRLTVAKNCLSGRLSTVKRARWPTCTASMSDSPMETCTCIWERSWAMLKRLGVLKLAATVWPTSASFEMTTPSTGALMSQ